MRSLRVKGIKSRIFKLQEEDQGRNDTWEVNHAHDQLVWDMTKVLKAEKGLQTLHLTNLQYKIFCLFQAINLLIGAQIWDFTLYGRGQKASIL